MSSVGVKSMKMCEMLISSVGGYTKLCPFPLSLSSSSGNSDYSIFHLIANTTSSELVCQ